MLEAAVVGRGLEGFESVDVQPVVDAARELGAHAGNRLEKRRGVGRATQAVELRPAMGHQHLGDGGGDAQAHVVNRVESGDTLVLVDLAHVARQLVERPGCVAVGVRAIGIGALGYQQLGRLPQAIGDALVLQRSGHGKPGVHQVCPDASGPERISATSSSETWSNSR